MATGVESGPGGGLDVNVLESGLSLAGLFAGIPGANLIGIALTLYNFAQWLVSFFSGVPHDAKTLGAGQVLVHSSDPLTAYYGAQLITGAHAGRVLSESSGMASFEVLAAAIPNALYKLANNYPASQYWDQAGEFNGAPVQQLKNIPPPPGAPYTEPVDAAVVALGPLPSATDYQQQNGFPVPTQPQLVDFLNSGQMLTWQQVPTTAASIAQLHQIVGQGVANNFGKWLPAQPTTQPPSEGPGGPIVPPQPTNGDEFLDCCYETQTNLAAIYSQLQALRQGATGQPSAECCAQILSELTLIAGAIQALPQQIAAAMPAGPGAPDLTAITTALQEINSTLASLAKGATDGKPTPASDLCDCLKPLLQAIEAQLEKVAGPLNLAAAPASGRLKALCEYLDANGMGGSALTQILLL